MVSQSPADDTGPELPRSEFLTGAASIATIGTAAYAFGKEIPKYLISKDKLILQVIDSEFMPLVPDDASEGQACHRLVLRLTSNCIHTLLVEDIQLTASQGPISAKEIEIEKINSTGMGFRAFTPVMLPQKIRPEAGIEIRISFCGLVPEPKERSVILTYSTLAQHRNEKLTSDVKLMWE